MFKQENRDRHLYVKPGGAIWSIEDGLNKGDIRLSGGLANQTCPAHPSSLIDQTGNANNWETHDGVKGGVLLRCATHDPANAKWLVKQGRKGYISKEKVGAYLCQQDKERSCLLSVLDLDVQQEVANWNHDATEKIACTLSLEFAQWLVEQAREGKWDKSTVGSALCRENKERGVILSLLPFEVQKEVASWNREKTNEAAHLVGFDFVNWLISLAMQGKWDKKEVGRVVCRKNMDDQLIMTTLDKETQKAVAVFNKSKTCSALPYMEQEKEFLHWLYQEAVEGRWEKQMVFKALVKEEVDGELILTTSKKKGTVVL